MFDCGNYSTKSKYYDNSNKLIIDKMKLPMLQSKNLLE